MSNTRFPVIKNVFNSIGIVFKNPVILLLAVGVGFGQVMLSQNAVYSALFAVLGYVVFLTAIVAYGRTIKGEEHGFVQDIKNGLGYFWGMLGVLIYSALYVGFFVFLGWILTTGIFWVLANYVGSINTLSYSAVIWFGVIVGIAIYPTIRVLLAPYYLVEHPGLKARESFGKSLSNTKGWKKFNLIFDKFFKAALLGAIIYMGISMLILDNLTINSATYAVMAIDSLNGLVAIAFAYSFFLAYKTKKSEDVAGQVVESEVQVGEVSQNEMNAGVEMAEKVEQQEKSIDSENAKDDMPNTGGGLPLS